jgi:hypothetical protein
MCVCLAGVLAADSGYGGNNIQKKPYVKPEIKSEVLEPGALGTALSGGDDDKD